MLSLAWRTFICALCACVLGASGCGEVLLYPDGGPGDTDGPTVDFDASEMPPDATPVDPCAGPIIDFDAVAECLVPAECEFLVACGQFPGTQEQCEEQLADDPDTAIFLRRVDDAIADGRMSYNGAMAFACIDSIDPEDCIGGFDDPACDLVFNGEVAAGSDCYDDDECEVEGSSCTGPNCVMQCCLGECVSPVGVGANCSTTIRCEPGAYCVTPVGGGQAVCRSGAATAPCTGDFQCDDGLYCNTTMCAIQHPLGTHAVCTRDPECRRPERCVGDDVDGSGTCETADTVGDPCDDNCDGQLYCNGPAGTLGSCQNLPSLGAACNPPNRCHTPYLCSMTTNRCVERPVDGESCRSGDCAPGFFCTSEITGAVTGTCRAPLAMNNACASDRHCDSGICVDNGSGTRLCAAYMTCGG